MNQTQKSAIKAQNTIEVFFSEKLQVFYIKGCKNHQPTSSFKSLITCSKNVFNEFLTFLEQFRCSKELKFYEYSELKDRINDFLITSVASSKNEAA
ncbi:hypothetical protein [Tenacibaculum maritimum]|uniref:hypothetical protein n=1 Tax=Tenacibaculum maritimum TaxID=107401 RepID=UPI0038770197